jgi:putative endonuclease
MSFYYVYVLFSLKDRKLYIGYSTNLKTRYHNHLKGKVTATKNRLPLELIHYEAFKNNYDARTREKFLKSGFGRNELKKAIHRNLQELGYKYL